MARVCSSSVWSTDWLRGGVILVAMLLLGGCVRPNAAPNRTPGETPPVDVDMIEAPVRTTRDYREFTGRTASSSSVEVRARVSGYLRQSPQSMTRSAKSPPPGDAAQPQQSTESPLVTVHEGSFVHQGQLLFQIDPAPYQLALEQAQGNLDAAEAQLKRYNLDLARNKDLLNNKAVSQSDYDLAVANQAEHVGQIENLRATVGQAKLDLKYTRIESPINGLLGRTLITDGNLIITDSTVLTTIVATDPIYVYFNVDEHSLLDYRQRIRQGSVKSARDSRIEIRLGLANETGYPHEGVIDFVDNTTDPNTGNTKLRGVFENTDNALSPGLFARVQSPFTNEYEAVMVPTKALGMDQQGRYVMVVENDQATRRGVELGESQGDWTVIRQGIRGGETIVVNGLQKIRSGSKVRRMPESSSSTTSLEPTGEKGESSASQPMSAEKGSRK